VFEMTVVRKSVRYSTGDGVSQTARRLELEARKAAHDATDRASSVACTDKRHGTRLCRRGRSESVGQSSESNAGRLRERTTTRAGRLAVTFADVHEVVDATQSGDGTHGRVSDGCPGIFETHEIGQVILQESICLKAISIASATMAVPSIHTLAMTS